MRLISAGYALSYAEDPQLLQDVLTSARTLRQPWGTYVLISLWTMDATPIPAFGIPGKPCF